jgi:hypothetical protein
MPEPSTKTNFGSKGKVPSLDKKVTTGNIFHIPEMSLEIVYLPGSIPLPVIIFYDNFWVLAARNWDFNMKKLPNFHRGVFSLMSSGLFKIR